MSRLGKMPIPLMKGVEIQKTKEGKLTFKGPKGALEILLPVGFHLKTEGGVAVLERDENLDNASYGLYRSLIKNAIMGVGVGYEIKLNMVGVGYRAAVRGSALDLQVGNSHPTKLTIPKEVSVSVDDKGVQIRVFGPDKRLVGQFAAEVRAQKPPEPYKGKGIAYEGEYIRRKEGKAAKGKA